MVIISLWTERNAPERYVDETFPAGRANIETFLIGRVTVRMYKVETTVCQHFVEALSPAA